MYWYVGMDEGWRLDCNNVDIMGVNFEVVDLWGCWLDFGL